MEKLKAFFTNKITKAVEWVVLFAVVAGLIIGGITQEAITSGVGLVAGVIGAVALILKFISDNTSKGA